MGGLPAHRVPQIKSEHGNSIYFLKIIETAEGGISGVKGDVISLAGGE